MQDRLKKIVKYSLVFTTVALMATTAYFLLRAPVIINSSIERGQSEVDLKPKIEIDLSSSLNPSKTQVNIRNNTNPDFVPIYSARISGKTIDISFDEKNYLLPGSEYVLTITPYSKFLSLRGQETAVTFTTRFLKEGESLSPQMEEVISKTNDVFQDGNREGFKFITSLPIQKDKFIINDVYELNDGKVNVAVDFVNGGTAGDLLAWLKTQGTDTGKIVINQ